jgi:hypothetical protein
MPGPEQQVPVIRHQTIGGNADAGLGVGLRQNLFKGGVVSGLLKQRESADATVQDVIGEVSSSETWTARHGRSSTETAAILSRKDSRPLFLSPRDSRDRRPLVPQRAPERQPQPCGTMAMALALARAKQKK